ncbi:MAG: hypothetical protein MJE68_14070, partial [Proteobacteria bacterium]|nr:hypothetical protein [Pseudomonadota bacterium]
MSDNGTLYSAAIFEEFAKEYGFTHVTSSPKYPQANGTAERAVKTVKQLLKKNQDPYLAMLAYRSTPLENGYSPAELLMGRKIRTTLPMSKKQLQPNLPNVAKLRKKEKKIRDRMKRNFDRRHSVRTLKPLSPGDTVWIPERETGGTVENESNTRSYNVQTEDGTLRRNRRDLVLMPKTADTQSDERSEESTMDPTDQNQTERSSARDGTKTRSGRVS